MELHIRSHSSTNSGKGDSVAYTQETNGQLGHFNGERELAPSLWSPLYFEMNSSSSWVFPRVWGVRRLTWHEKQCKMSFRLLSKAFCLSCHNIKQVAYQFSQLLSDNRKWVKTVIFRPCIWVETVLKEQSKKSMEIEKKQKL